MAVGVTLKGSFNNIEKFFKGMVNSRHLSILEKYGQEGVTALTAATPKDTGDTANSWLYEVKYYRGGASIIWSNTNIVGGVPIVILLQYGHATRDGGYVQGRDYINPALKPIFDKIATEAWREVTKS